MSRTVPNLRLLAGFCMLLVAASSTPATAELVVLDNGRLKGLYDEYHPRA